MVEQYVGNAVRLAYRASAKATSDFAINKREKELDKLKFMYNASKDIPYCRESNKRQVCCWRNRGRNRRNIP